MGFLRELVLIVSVAVAYFAINYAFSTFHGLLCTLQIAYREGFVQDYRYHLRSTKACAFVFMIISLVGRL